MEKILIRQINYDIALEFFKGTLKDGNYLAKKLLKIIDFNKGHFFSILAKSADISKLNALNSDGILPLNAKENILVSGKNYIKQKKANSTSELAVFLNTTLKKISKGLSIFEELSLEKGNGALTKSEFEIKYYAKEVYYFLNGEESSVKKLHTLIKQADAMWYYMNIITKSEFLIERELLSLEDIQTLVANVNYVILGAYNMEGYICWEKLE